VPTDVSSSIYKRPMVSISPPKPAFSAQDGRAEPAAGGDRELPRGKSGRVRVSQQPRRSQRRHTQGAFLEGDLH